ncbi:HNH endonuclease family protein [Streptomyces bottropensis]|uniref:HNH endonuclease family protein n=1 Tax=Streptomyces bottropensis TaxID=42235 RepID=UPI0036A1C526
MPVRDALLNLPVQEEPPRGDYSRSKFKHWNAGLLADGCNTRAEVLKAEALTAPEQGPNCALTGGLWYSPYDDRHLDSARSLDIDHLVPLAEAWDSGARAWTAQLREAYANDQDDERALIAVSAASNRSKSDQDPGTWLPPHQGYHCQYATDWIADKSRYQLSVDPAEQAALADVLNDCPNETITVIFAA